MNKYELALTLAEKQVNKWINEGLEESKKNDAILKAANIHMKILSVSQIKMHLDKNILI